MKRYFVEGFYDPEEVRQTESEDGDWVLYEDVRKQRDELLEALEDLLRFSSHETRDKAWRLIQHLRKPVPSDTEASDD